MNIVELGGVEGEEEETKKPATPLTREKITNNETTSKPTQGYGKGKHSDDYEPPVDNTKKATA
jgi:hypothetical protein